MSRRHQSDTDRMLVALKNVNINPVLEEFNHNPLWIIPAILIFICVANVLEVVWMIIKDVKRAFFKVLWYPKRFIRNRIKVVRHFFDKRYGRKRKK